MRTWSFFLLALVFCGLSGELGAQQYPSKTVTVIVPFPPGGSIDFATRIVAEHLSRSLGQPFVVLNKPGAAGNIGTAQGAKSAPDGYTLVHGYLGTIAIHPTLYGAKLPYRPEKDLVPVAPLAGIPFFMVTHPSLPSRTVPEFVALAKSKPGMLTYGTAGVGSTQHVVAELFRAAAGIDIRSIPFNGSGPADAALLGGHISMIFNAGHVMKQVRAGKLTALAVTTPQRLAELPDLPTVAETYPGFEASSWHGLFAPAGTPEPVIELLNARIAEALAHPDTQKRFAAAQINVLSMSVNDFSAFVREETAKWAKVIQTSGMRLE